MTLSTTERATESMVGPEERTQDVPAQDPAAPEIAPVRVAFGRADALAMLVLAVLSVALFGPHVLGLGTFIGNSDRLHSFLNVRELEVHAFQTVGRVPAWTDLSFMGLPVYGLHWMFPGLDGVAAVMALFPEQAVFRVAGYVSAAYVVCAALAAYLLIRDVVRSPFPALIGAALYVCSTFAVHRISQVDSAFAVLIFQPIGLLILRRLRTGRLAIGFVGLVAVVVGLAGFTFLQETAYMLIFLGLYACYRLVLVRDWRPFVVLGAAGLVGIMIAVPRLGNVVEDIRETSRTSSFLGSCPCEVLRWLDDGIFGRYPQEAAALGNGINLSEGLQLYTSTFAAAAIVAGLLRPRGIIPILLGGVFLATLVLVSQPIIGTGRIFYGLLGIAGALTLWALVRPLFGRLFGMPRSVFVRDRDLWFLTIFVAFAFAVVLSDTVRYAVYVAFFRVDFSHSRISAAALLPLCVLAAAFVDELAGDPETARHTTTRTRGLALVAGLAVAIVVVLALGLGGQVVARVLFGSADRVRLGTWIYLQTGEAGKLAAALAVFGAALGVHWLARHAHLTRTDESFQLSWRSKQPDAGLSAARLVPTYALGCLMAVQAFGNAYYQINDRHTWTFPDPFLGNNNLTVPVDALHPPSPAALQAVHDRLEPDAYRSIVVSAPDGYPTYDAPSERGYPAFLSQFWQLRLLEGYPILPERVAELPWPDASRSVRSILFKDEEVLPWPLLSILNVKYAVIANPSFYFNVGADGARRGAEASPSDLKIVENPLPVLPRAFFTGSIVPRVVTPAVKTPLPPPPAAIRARIMSDRQVYLSWVGDIPEASYRVYRRQLVPPAESVDALVSQTLRGAGGFDNPGLLSGATYAYRVQACDSRGCGEMSPPVVTRLASGKLAAPKLLSVEPQSGTEALVTWSLDDPDATTTIEVYTALEAKVGEPIEVGPGDRSYVVGMLRPLHNYLIRLRACTTAGCSPHSEDKSLSTPSSLSALDLDDLLPADPTSQSIVDGLDAPRTFETTSGAIRATYQADRVRLDVDPASSERFLVLNEMYHPGWRAYAGGTELKVWPVNIAMRGILVPAGVTEIELRFEPFFVSWPARLSVVVGLLLGAIGWLVFRRLDRVDWAGARRVEAPAGPPVEPTERREVSRV